MDPIDPPLDAERVAVTVAPDPPAPRRSVLEWRDLKGTAAHVFAGARARERWETSPQVEPTAITEATYDAIVRSVEFDRI